MKITCSDSVRLVNGTSLCSGRLEVKTNQSTQTWSSVCQQVFDQQDAEVVCRELGCGTPLVLQGGLYGDGEPPMWTKEFQCGGNESALLDCRSSDGTTTCSPGPAAGLTCSEPVRLVGGSSRCTGTLEVKRGNWRPVDVSDWTLKEAAVVVCGELDCGSAVSTGRRNESSPISAWRISQTCINSGFTLRECVTPGSSSSIMKITCSEPVRLVGGSSRCTGTLEVKRGDWRPVDVSDWTLKEAAVVCGELDCGSAVSAGRRNESSPRSAWRISQTCIHSGFTLRECVTPGPSSSIMKITCSDSVRLVNGTSLCSGRLEVKTNQSTQTWSSVCQQDFDQQDAEVVCRELGCGTPLVLQGGLYGDGEPPMWTKEFQCGGNESALLDCRSSDGTTTCSPGPAAGLTCSEPVRLVGGWSRCTGTLEVNQGDWRPLDGSDQTPKESASVYCRKLNCSSPLYAGSREDAYRPAWKIHSTCVQSGSALRECITPSGSSSSVLELTCLHPAAVPIRLVVLPLALLLVTVVIYFIVKASRGRMRDPRENMELDYHNLGAEGARAAV
ncbi:scavenger receptor cysteine-rich type 1 protein M130 [Etheostoma spectabile]|uniref:scavenger receptor cysteine-rich type 1 protein M130 n=1 Tax=Etheostoma spectabile TaxID=54343 RepID=UPI0013AFA171|nr:scavenger receptor cysteine-rich type 1 protein M130-like [Etheostoma spectabile]